MGIEIDRGDSFVGLIDPGTGTVKQAKGPVTYEQPVGNRESSATVKQQPKTVVIKDPARNTEGTGLTQQRTEPETSTDPTEVLRKRVKEADVEDKSVKAPATKGTKPRG